MSIDMAEMISPEDFFEITKRANQIEDQRDKTVVLHFEFPLYAAREMLDMLNGTLVERDRSASLQTLSFLHYLAKNLDETIKHYDKRHEGT